MRLALLLALLAPCAAPNTYHGTQAIWQHTRRCDMIAAKASFLRSYHQKSDYTEGEWVAASALRPSAAAMPLLLTPTSCNATHDACPLGSCVDNGAVAADLCGRLSQKCYGRVVRGQMHDRPSHALYAQFVGGAQNWAWQPRDGCHFSPVVSEPNAHQWRGWAATVEAGAGPMLWVGDTHLGALHLAFSDHTGGATKSDYVRSDTLVNAWTLAPMTAAQVAACEASAGASSGDAATPCPPSQRHPTRWREDNRAIQLSQMRWTAAFEAKAATLGTLVLGVGSEWWRLHDYPDSQAGCHRTSYGVADAFTPLSSLGLVDHMQYYRTCDVYDVKFRLMAASVAKYVSSVGAFKGKVVFVTSPSGVKGCEASAAPVPSIPAGGANGGAAAMMQTPTSAMRHEESPSKRAFWYESNPQGGVLPPDASGAFHTFGRLRGAERLWAAEFSKHAGRLKATLLNLSSMSDGRADVLVRGAAPGDECLHWCFPGLPHLWSEMMLRLLEQTVYGATDGLY